MTRIKIEPDCGNAPKKLLLKDFNVACAKGNQKQIINYLTEDVDCEIAGGEKLRGRENFIAALKLSPKCKAKELIVEVIITHGAEACVNGKIIGADNAQYLFCDVYKFKSAGSSQISHVTSFVVQG